MTKALRDGLNDPALTTQQRRIMGIIGVIALIPGFWLLYVFAKVIWAIIKASA